MASPSQAYLDAITVRRTNYTLTKQLPISEEKVTEIVRHALTHTPSAYNSQTTRIVVLLGKKHDQFWAKAREVLKPIVPDSVYGKIDLFEAGYVSILFLEDQKTINEMEAIFPAERRFPQWSEHTSAMHQHVIWTALALEGAGVNLQHFNPLVDVPIATEFGIPPHWSLKAHIVAGGKAKEPGEKTWKPLEEKLIVQS